MSTEVFFYLGVNELGKYLVVVVDDAVVVVVVAVVVCSVIISSLLDFFLIGRVDGMLKIRSKKVKRIFSSRFQTSAEFF